MKILNLNFDLLFFYKSAKILSNYGMIHKRRMDFKEAIKTFEKAHEIQVCFFENK